MIPKSISYSKKSNIAMADSILFELMMILVIILALLHLRMKLRRMHLMTLTRAFSELGVFQTFICWEV